LPENVRIIKYYDNPIFDIIPYENMDRMKAKIKIWNRFRELFYTLKYKSRFRSWLWEKVRLQKIKNQFHPSHLMTQLENEEVDLDEVLVDWISEMP
jgi:hypothetical protein